MFGRESLREFIRGEQRITREFIDEEQQKSRDFFQTEQQKSRDFFRTEQEKSRDFFRQAQRRTDDLIRRQAQQAHADREAFEAFNREILLRNEKVYTRVIAEMEEGRKQIAANTRAVLSMLDRLEGGGAGA